YLLCSVKNNLGAETHITYAPSTQFYLSDQLRGSPWVTRLPFPVQLVSAVDTYDWVGRVHVRKSFEYHDGYFDPEDREFRGFGMVEEVDTERYEVFASPGQPSIWSNIEASSHVPPVRRKTWFHTGAFLQGERLELGYARAFFGAPLPSELNYESKFAEFLKTV